jgi:hypothetical protein
MKKYTLVLLMLVFFYVAHSQELKRDSFQTASAEIENQTNIFPNPTKYGKVNIQVQSSEISEVVFSNITGKQVLVKKYQHPEKNVQLQVNDLPNGIYLVQIKLLNQKAIVKKLLVSKN